MIALLRIGVCCIAALLAASPAQAGNQLYEPMSASVRAALSKSVSDTPVSNVAFFDDANDQAWLNEMSRRLASRMPDAEQRIAFLNTVHYEALRAGLDPELVLGLIEVESGFKNMRCPARLRAVICKSCLFGSAWSVRRIRICFICARIYVMAAIYCVYILIWRKAIFIAL